MLLRKFFITGIIFITILPAALTGKELRLINLGELLIDWDPRNFDTLMVRTADIKDSLDLEYMDFPKADIIFGNLETALERDSGSLQDERTNPTSFFHGTQHTMLDALQEMFGVNMLSMANNHSYDFGPKGIKVGMTETTKRGITYAGIGENINEACLPRKMKTAEGLDVALMATTRNLYRGRGKASPEKSGVCYLSKSTEPFILDLIYNYAKTVDYFIMYSHDHWEDVTRKPVDKDEYPVTWSRKVIDAGADVYLYDGPHQPAAFEVYKGRPIMYAPGNLIYHTKQDPFISGAKSSYPWRHWVSYFSDMIFQGDSLKAMKLYPIETNEIGTHGRWNGSQAEKELHYKTRGIPQMAKGHRAEFILAHVGNLCNEIGTKIEIKGEVAYWGDASLFEVSPPTSISKFNRNTGPGELDARWSTLQSGRQLLTVNSDEAGPVEVSLFSTAGKKLWTSVPGGTRSSYSVELPGRLLEGGPGVYFLKARIGSRTLSKTMTLTR